jgi:hypothetical protein
VKPEQFICRVNQFLFSLITTQAVAMIKLRRQEAKIYQDHLIFDFLGIFLAVK